MNELGCLYTHEVTKCAFISPVEYKKLSSYFRSKTRVTKSTLIAVECRIYLWTCLCYKMKFILAV